MNATTLHAQPDQSTAARTLRSVDLAGPAGRLEAVVNEGSPHARFAAVVAHPHPLCGGTLHNKVVYHAMKALNDPAFGFACPVLRFNFRGTGRSQGTHHGQAESADVQAALQWLQHEYSLPIIAVGFSFGAAITLAACCSEAKDSPIPAAVIALGLPIHSDCRNYEYPSLKNCAIPKLFLSGDQDPFASPDELMQVAAAAADPKRLVLLPRADHFFTGHLDAMQSSLAAWLKEQLL